MQQKSIGRGRKAALFGFGTTAFVLALASTAFACVAFMGQMTVDGHDGDTTVVGTGNSHGYCSTGRPTTAAAGHLNDTVSLTVSPGKCADSGAIANHKLPAGVYEVRYNSAKTYTFDGTYWNMTPGTGCFRPGNVSSIIGTFNVDAAGNGSWSGLIVPTSAVSPVPDASNFCIGSPTVGAQPGTSGGFPGLLAPYQLLI